MTEVNLNDFDLKLKIGEVFREHEGYYGNYYDLLEFVIDIRGYYHENYGKVKNKIGKLIISNLIRESSDGEGNYPYVLHIPVPIFYDFLLEHDVYDIPVFLSELLRLDRKKRTGDFFQCPVCGTKSYYSGVCDYCWYSLDEYEKEYFSRLTELKNMIKNDIMLGYRENHTLNCLPWIRKVYYVVG